MRFRNLSMVAAAALSILGLSNTTRADDKSEIAGQYAKLAKAMSTKDVKGMMALCSKDFTYTEAGKTMTSAQLSAQMTQQFAIIQGNPVSKVKVVSCKVKGKSAAAVAMVNTEMMIPGQDQKSHKLVSVAKSNDILIKTPNGWLMKTIVVVDPKMTFDGKPFDPSKMAPPPAPAKKK